MTRKQSALATPRGSLARGLILLEHLGAHPEGLTLSELSRASGLSLSTAHRLLTTHQQFKFVQRNAVDRHYSLGLRLLELGHGASRSLSLAEAGIPVMRELANEARETLLLAILDGTDVVFIARCDSGRSVTIHGDVGDRAPSYCTATGKVMLAALPLDQLSSTIAAMRFRSYSATTITDKDRLLECLHEVRKNGFALANQEYDEGIASIGVPVVGSAGNVVGGLCIAAPSYRTSVSELTKWLVPLKRAAREIGSHVTARH